MDMCPTESNLQEKEQASESDVLVDPVAEDDEEPVPSHAAPRAEGRASCATDSAQASTAELPSVAASTAARQPPLDEEGGRSSSPTLELDTSPQVALIRQRARRRMELPSISAQRKVETMPAI
ncbi:uncharacterized protein ACNLHF_009890 isoform 1-T4 [Anomaloglossus baeobatrachus]